MAWLITAPSGSGKTTQLKNWQEIVGDDMTVINGDKPVISCRDEGIVYMSSSPWMGKEWYGNCNISAKLGGIILLEQGDHNEIKRLCSKDAVLPLFLELLSYPDNTDQIHMMGRLLGRILEHTPVWKLTNLGNLDSTELTKETILKYVEAPR